MKKYCSNCIFYKQVENHEYYENEHQCLVNTDLYTDALRTKQIFADASTINKKNDCAKFLSANAIDKNKSCTKCKYFKIQFVSEYCTAYKTYDRSWYEMLPNIQYTCVKFDLSVSFFTKVKKYLKNLINRSNL